MISRLACVCCLSHSICELNHLTTLTLTELVADAAELLHYAGQIVALTGAGISTESGIPDFRSPGSIWREAPPVNYRDFISRAEARQQYWQTRRNLSALVQTARPNAAHYALTALERAGRLAGLITQNFDGLHLQAGNAPENVVELHGTSRAAACTLCGRRSSMHELQMRVDAGEIDPRCPACRGFLKAATILFGQRAQPAIIVGARWVICVINIKHDAPPVWFPRSSRPG